MITANTNAIHDVGQLLKGSAHEVFATVFRTMVNPVDNSEVMKINTTLIVGSISLVGDFNGTINLYIKPALAQKLASRMLGIPEDKVEGDEIIDDVVGELSNMIVGATKCRLNDSGTPCSSTLPTVVRENGFRPKPPGGSEERYIRIAFEDQIIMLQIVVGPASQPT